MQANSEFLSGASKIELTDEPISPDWIIDGDPRARNKVISHNLIYKTSVWDCQAGTFFWYYDTYESVIILDGETTITNMAGVSFHLKPGDAAQFAQGDWLHWHIPHYVRKFAIWGQPGTTVARHMAGVVNAKLRGLLSGGKNPGGERPALSPMFPVYRDPGETPQVRQMAAVNR